MTPFSTAGQLWFLFSKNKNNLFLLEERLARKGADNICNLKERSPLNGNVSLVFIL